MDRDFAALSDREKQTLRLLLAGHEAKSIAGVLGLSVHTVNDRLREARRKLGVSSSRAAARLLAEAETATPDFLVPEPLGVGAAPSIADGSGRQDRPRSARSRLPWIIGGLLVMSLVIALAALASSTTQGGDPATSAAPSTDMAMETGAAAALRWVALVDAARWSDSWRQASTMFRTQVSDAQWTGMVRPVRDPLGAVVTRSLQSVQATTTLPGVPAGEYTIVQFKTAFAKRADAVETVVLTHEAGDWKVAGYFIR